MVLGKVKLTTSRTEMTKVTKKVLRRPIYVSGTSMLSRIDTIYAWGLREYDTTIPTSLKVVSSLS